MRCSQCAALSFSAAAKTLVEQGERCPQCGGEMTLAPVERQPVAVAMHHGAGAEPDDSGRRFDRG